MTRNTGERNSNSDTLGSAPTRLSKQTDLEKKKKSEQLFFLSFFSAARCVSVFPFSRFMPKLEESMIGKKA